MKALMGSPVSPGQRQEHADVIADGNDQRAAEGKAKLESLQPAAALQIFCKFFQTAGQGRTAVPDILRQNLFQRLHQQNQHVEETSGKNPQAAVGEGHIIQQFPGLRSQGGIVSVDRETPGGSAEKGGEPSEILGVFPVQFHVPGIIGTR